MTEMIERVARAIYAAEGNTRTAPGEPTRPMTLEDEPEDERAIYFDYARAAIEAMRDPTEDMVDGGNSLGHDEAPATYYTAMIDAALQ